MTNKLSQSDRAVLSLLEAGNGAFVTCESGPVGRARVVIRLPSVEHAQAFHRALIKCGDAARRLIQGESQEQNGLTLMNPVVHEMQPVDYEPKYDIS